MKTNPLKTTLTSLLCGLVFVLGASLSHAQTALESYVGEGLKSNLVLQQKNLSLQQAEQALQTARSYFLPSVNVLTDYTSGQGGRSISIPVGDLLNPVYASLNQMTQSDAFPQIENVKQNFFPRNFYDAKVRTSLPLINTDLLINKNIQGQQVMLRQLEIEAYKRTLVLDIKTSYYNLLSAEAAVRIYESALGLVEKNVEVNESLLKNGKNLPSNVLRAKSEAQHVKSDLNSARNRVANARSYFNFLLNRDLATPVDTDTQNVSEGSNLAYDSAQHEGQREEIQMLKAAKEINLLSLQMSRLGRLPKMSAFIDLGSQASDWKYNQNSRYYLLGVQFSMPLFNGFRSNIAARQSKIEIQKTQQNLANTERQLELASTLAKNDYQAAVENIAASDEQLKAAQSYFNLVEKGYREGVNSLIEYLDARNQLTSSQLLQNIRQFEMLIAGARVERETASYTLND
jgi:outer membrane protein